MKSSLWWASAVFLALWLTEMNFLLFWGSAAFFGVWLVVLAMKIGAQA